MLLHRLYALTALALGMIPGTTFGSFGPSDAAAHAVVRLAAPLLPQRVDFKVVVWYRKSDALGTFKYEVYDVRKGEYTPNVDEWIKDVQTKYPGYYVVLRNVDLLREKGKTEMLKVGSVIQRELAVAAASSGLMFGPGLSPSNPRIGSGVATRSTAAGARPGSNALPGSSGRDRDYLTPASPSFPVPVPYPHLPR